MAEVTILYWRDDDGRTTPVRFDAVTGLTPEDVGTPTSHPVERGVNVVDHVRDEPDRITIEAVMSTVPNLEIDEDVEFAPLDLTAHTKGPAGQQTIGLFIPSPPIQPDLVGLITAGLDALGLFPPPKVQVSTQPDSRVIRAQARALQQRTPRDRIRDVYEQLLDAKAKRRLITIGTRDRDWFDMLLTRVGAPRTNASGGTRFELDLEKLRVADSETVEAPKPAEVRGALQKKKGTQSAKDAANEDQYQGSLAGQAVGATAENST